MTVENPHLFFLLLGLIPITVLSFWVYLSGIASLKKLTDSLYKGKLLKSYFKKFIASLFWVCIAFTAMVVALADVRWKRVYTVTQTSGVDVVFVVDISNSMLSTDLAPNRLERVKQVIASLTEERESCRYALVLFKGAATVQIPMTGDLHAFDGLVPLLSPNIMTAPGTSIEAGLSKARSVFPPGRETRKIIYLFTDGGHREPSEAYPVIDQLNKEKILLIPVACGTEGGGPVFTESNKILNDKNGNPLLVPMNRDFLESLAQSAHSTLRRLNHAGLVLELQTLLDDELAKVGASEHGVSFASESSLFLLIAFLALLMLLGVRMHHFGDGL